MKSFRHISGLALLLAALFCACACDGHGGGDDPAGGTGDVIVNISNPDGLETKHSDGEGDSAHDGGIMKTLGVWLITDGAANGDGNYTILQRDLSTPDAATHTVTFKDVARGNYFLVIAANYDQTTMTVANYGPGTSVTDDFTASFVRISPTSEASALSDGQSPAFDDTYGMPSSFEKTLSVAAGENVINASLRRCVGRLTFNVRNNLDDYELFIHSMGLSKYNKSQGYVFESKDNSSVSYVEFPDFDSAAMGDTLVHVAPRAYKNIYDIYLFETNPGLEFKFDMLAALYQKDTPASSVNVTGRAQAPYEIQGNTTDFDSNNRYMIRSDYSSNIYLGDTGSSGSGNLVATELTSDGDIKALSNITSYFWKFSSSAGSSTTIQNVATGNYLTISSSGISLSNSSSYVWSSESSSTNTLQFYVWDWGYKYLSFNGTEISQSTSSNKTTRWVVRPVKDGTSSTIYYFDNPGLEVVEIPRNDRIIKYIDSYGASQPLTKIDRNEHVTVNINVFYNRELGQFDFAVEDWNDGGDHYTTFD